MITKLDYRAMNCKRLVHLFMLSFLNSLFFGTPLISNISLELLPHTNFKEALIVSSGMNYALLILNVSITCYIISMFEELIHCGGFCYGGDFNVENQVLLSTSNYSKYDFNRLDLSNPFLYSDKAKALIE